MADLVTISDYIGDYQFQQDVTTEAKFNSIRDEHDRVWIRKLLGATLGNLFLTDFDSNAGVPTGRFATIYAAIQEEINGVNVESLGMKYFTKSIVWFYYARQNNITVSAGGNKAKKSQNSQSVNQSTFFVKNYNAGIRTGRAIQAYIRQNSSTYSEYNGEYLDFIF